MSSAKNSRGVALNLNVGELGKVMDMVMQPGRPISAWAARLLRQDDLLVQEKIGSLLHDSNSRAPYHPLAWLRRPLDAGGCREEVQMVVTRYVLALPRAAISTFWSYRTWRVSDIATRHQLIKGGLGWGGLPAVHGVARRI